MEFRKAEPDEISSVIGLVSDVFYNEQGVPREMNPLPEEKSPVWWCSVDDAGKIVGGLCAWTEENGEKHFGRFVTAPEMRGRQIGTQLMKSALEDAFSNGAEAVHLDARDKTVRIICRLGGRVTGEPFEFYGSLCTPVTIEKDAFEAEAALE